MAAPEVVAPVLPLVAPLTPEVVASVAPEVVATAHVIPEATIIPENLYLSSTVTDRSTKYQQILHLE